MAIRVEYKVPGIKRIETTFAKLEKGKKAATNGLKSVKRKLTGIVRSMERAYMKMRRR